MKYLDSTGLSTLVGQIKSKFALKTELPTDTDTTYTFANGTNGSFTVTPSGGKAQTVTIGKPSTAGTADKATSDGSGNNIANTYATKVK